MLSEVQTTEGQSDVVAAGGTVTLSGPVTGGILSGAGTLSIGGTVGRSVRAAAGNLTLRAAVGTVVKSGLPVRELARDYAWCTSVQLERHLADNRLL